MNELRETEGGSDTDVFSESESLAPLHNEASVAENNDSTEYLQLRSFINRRRASLDTQQITPDYSHSQSRRSSIGAFVQTLYSKRRSSLEEDTLRLNLLKLSCFSSNTSIPMCGRRQSIESEGSLHLPCRRSSLGAESLIEYDIDEDINDSDAVTEPTPQALLSLQYADDVFAIKSNLERRFHPRQCLSAQPQVHKSTICS